MTFQQLTKHCLLPVKKIQQFHAIDVQLYKNWLWLLLLYNSIHTYSLLGAQSESDIHNMNTSRGMAKERINFMMEYTFFMSHVQWGWWKSYQQILYITTTTTTRTHSVHSLELHKMFLKSFCNQEDKTFSLDDATKKTQFHDTVTCHQRDNQDATKTWRHRRWEGSELMISVTGNLELMLHLWQTQSLWWNQAIWWRLPCKGRSQLSTYTDLYKAY